jgi:hypothetical protein
MGTGVEKQPAGTRSLRPVGAEVGVLTRMVFVVSPARAGEAKMAHQDARERRESREIMAARCEDGG